MAAPPPEQQDVRCWPDWYRNAANKSTAVCPYGHKLEYIEVTVPHEMTFPQAIAVVYSTIPYLFVSFLLVRWIIHRSSKETSWLLLACFAPTITGVLASSFAQPRPRSCLFTCGLPPDHAVFCVTLLIVLMWDDVIHRNDETKRRLLRGSTYIGLLLPQAWSRVALGDASSFQAWVGLLVGVLLAVLWIAVIGPAVNNYVRYWILGHVDRKNSEDFELELASFGLGPRSPLDAPQVLDEFGLPAISDSEVTSEHSWNLESASPQPPPLRGEAAPVFRGDAAATAAGLGSVELAAFSAPEDLMPGMSPPRSRSVSPHQSPRGGIGFDPLRPASPLNSPRGGARSRDDLAASRREPLVPPFRSDAGTFVADAAAGLAAEDHDKP